MKFQLEIYISVFVLNNFFGIKLYFVTFVKYLNPINMIRRASVIFKS